MPDHGAVAPRTGHDARKIIMSIRRCQDRCNLLTFCTGLHNGMSIGPSPESALRLESPGESHPAVTPDPQTAPVPSVTAPARMPRAHRNRPFPPGCAFQQIVVLPG